MIIILLENITFGYLEPQNTGFVKITLPLKSEKKLFSIILAFKCKNLY